jgi:hypothetical protein
VTGRKHDGPAYREATGFVELRGTDMAVTFEPWWLVLLLLVLGTGPVVLFGTLTIGYLSNMDSRLRDMVNLLTKYHEQNHQDLERMVSILERASGARPAD